MRRRPAPTGGRWRWLLAAAPLGLVGLTGCGISTENADREAQPNRGLRQGQRARPQLPRRPRGVVQVNGGVRGGFSPLVVDGFNASAQGVRATFAATGEDAGFRDLCAGRTDVVESVREISAAELAACRRRGITVAPKLQVASDAVIVATRNESDVGGDCMTVGDVNTIYRAGSPITNWSQLGFDDLRLRTTGPLANSNVFDFFTQRVFGTPSGAGLSTFRADYQARSTEDEIRFLVINRAGLERERRAAAARVRRALRSDQADRRRLIAAAERAADRSALRKINAINARNRRLKITVDGPKLIASNRRLVEREKAAARARAIRAFNRRALARANEENSLALLRAERPGYVGYFRFTYYENFEDQLRPFEIDPTGLVAPGAQNAQAGQTQGRVGQRTTATPVSSATPRRTGATRPNCVFPSQTTITNGQYPLSRAILLYVGQQNARRPEVQAFLTYHLQNSQRVATANRLVPIPDRQRDEQLAAVTGRQPTPQTQGSGAPSSAPPGGGSGVPGVASPSQGTGSR